MVGHGWEWFLVRCSAQLEFLLAALRISGVITKYFNRRERREHKEERRMKGFLFPTDSGRRQVANQEDFDSAGRSEEAGFGIFGF